VRQLRICLSLFEKKKKHNPDKRGDEQEAERQKEIDWESERGRVLRYYAQQRWKMREISRLRARLPDSTDIDDINIDDDNNNN